MATRTGVLVNKETRREAAADFCRAVPWDGTGDVQLKEGGRSPVVPFVAVDQMRAVDRMMTEDYGVYLVQLMESAGRNLAHLARRRFLGGDPRDRRVLVLVGSDGKGGSGMVAARRLAAWGALVRVYLAAPSARLEYLPGHQRAILQRMGVPVDHGSLDTWLGPADLIVDALIGSGSRGAPKGVAAALIRQANQHGAPVLALDVPSGVDATTGQAHDPAIRAAATLTLALPKKGLRGDVAKEYVGELYVGDVGVPPEVYARPPLGLRLEPIFAADDIVRLW